jgi:hypothetical protein
VVRAGGVARCRPDALVLLLDQLFVHALGGWLAA